MWETAMPEHGQQNSARWRVDGWSLRSKVAVVLMLPALVALVLGGARVKSQLDDASRLSTVRDQLAVLRDSVVLAELVAGEMVTVAANAPVDGLDLTARKIATDERAAAVRRAADFARLPTGVSRILGDALGRLSTLRQRPLGGNDDLIAAINGYHEVVNGLSGLVPGVVSLARQVDLDESARSVSSLLLLRATLATENALLRSTRVSSIDSATAAGNCCVTSRRPRPRGSRRRPTPRRPGAMCSRRPWPGLARSSRRPCCRRWRPSRQA
jgi:hypothetical protein